MIDNRYDISTPKQRNSNYLSDQLLYWEQIKLRLQWQDLRPVDVLTDTKIARGQSLHQPPLPKNSISLFAFQKLFGKLLVPLHYILFIPEQLSRNNFI
jgi:hypothetical protein